MKKTMCVMLCLLMCVSVLPIFASCGKNKGRDIDFSDCKIIYADNLGKLPSKAMSDMMRQMNGQLGTNIKSQAVSGATSDSAYEILIGRTGYKETDKALKSLKNGTGYTIQVIKNKVVIVGTTDALTYLAIQQFCDTYLNEKRDSAVLPVEGSVVKDDCVLLELIGETGMEYTVVYSRKWDTTDENVLKHTAKLDEVDYQYRQVLNFISSVSQASGFRSMKSQDDKRNISEKEIILGTTERPETREALSRIGEKEYIVTCINNKIVATAWTDQGVQLAVEKLSEILCDCVEQTADGKRAQFPADLTYIGTYNTNWILDFPKPTGEGVDLYGLCDVADNHVEYCYKGTGVTAAAFGTYCQTLKDAGYSVYTDNTVEGSRFTTFTKGDHILHVTYSNYTHKLISSNYEPAIRVVSGSKRVTALPQVEANLQYNKVFTDENVGADTGALICQMYLSYEESNIFGNAYITMLEDGSFILYDGGGNGTGSSDNGLNIFGEPLVKAEEHVRLFSLFRDLQSLVGMRSKPITIAAWLMSHSHWDHITCFKDFCKNTGRDVIVEKAYANFASVYETFNSYNPGGFYADTLKNSLSETSGAGEYVKIHSGQTFWVRNAEIEVLYTHEDKFPDTIAYFNDTSTIYRVHYHVTDGKGHLDDGANGASTCVWLGDLWKEGSDLVSAMYGSYLKSDMVQLAHHGYNGCEKLIYTQISPSLVWWPVYGNMYIDQAYVSTSSSYNAVVDRYVANTQTSVKWIIVAGAITSANAQGYNKNYMSQKNEDGKFNYTTERHNYTLRVTKNGFDGDSLYFAGENYTGVGGNIWVGKAPVHGAGYRE